MSSRIALSLTLLAAIAAHGTAARADPARPKARVHQIFEMRASPEPDAEAIGSYEVRAVLEADQLAVEEHFSIVHRGNRVGMISAVRYRLENDAPPRAVSGRTLTTVDGQPTMRASFEIDGRRLTCSSKIGDREVRKRIDLPEGAVLVSPGHSLVGAMLLDRAGSIPIAWIEFPDDFDEPIHVKEGFKLSRSEPGPDGGYRIRVHSDPQEVSNVPMDKRNRIGAQWKLGKFHLREIRPPVS